MRTDTDEWAPLPDRSTDTGLLALVLADTGKATPADIGETDSEYFASRARMLRNLGWPTKLNHRTNTARLGERRCGCCRDLRQHLTRRIDRELNWRRDVMRDVALPLIRTLAAKNAGKYAAWSDGAMLRLPKGGFLNGAGHVVATR